ncbi:L-threonylcarbamoyladenylate synthase [Flectobacillus major]|uniref:L-threonylcarbamoyladenylate synthase n=1 Tax=Flectobacillus major TaxID=103 RepID=UPI00040C0B9A|nr:L-threonylcarbamoyladenylate synthase [Flectobacillus major]
MITTDIKQAVQLLANNEVIGIPTETVYGLAGNAYSNDAIKKIFTLKNRPFYNPLIVHIKSVDFLNDVACDIPDMAIKLAEKFWPGPLTLILKKQPHISDLITSGKETVAIRVPNHPLTLALLAKIPFPLAAPSANPFGSISPTSAQHVASYFNDNLAIILDGGICEKGVESTIVGFDNNQPILYRHGAIAVETLEQVVGKLQTQISNDTKPTAPGMLSRHYAPHTPTFLTNNVAEQLRAFSGKKIGLLLFEKQHLDQHDIHQEILSPTGDLEEAAKNLYAALHRLDGSRLDVIVVEEFPDKGLGKTINDRLNRATKK